MTSGVPTLYRYVDRHWDGSVRIDLLTFSVLSETPCGYWVYYGQEHRRRFVLKHSRKRFAHPTIPAALESFKRRKRAQIRILDSQLDRARSALLLSNEVMLPASTPALLNSNIL